MIELLTTKLLSMRINVEDYRFANLKWWVQFGWDSAVMPANGQKFLHGAPAGTVAANTVPHSK